MTEEHILGTWLIVAGCGVEAHRDPEFFNRRPQWIKVLVLHVAAVDRLRNHTQSDVPEFFYNPARFRNRQGDIMQRDQPRGFEVFGILLTEGSDPVVPGLA